MKFLYARPPYPAVPFTYIVQQRNVPLTEKRRAEALGIRSSHDGKLRSLNAYRSLSNSRY
jgi:hypothetical protein